MKRLFASAVMTAFITTYMGSSLTVAIPEIETDFNVSGSAVGWIINVYMIASAVFCLYFGKKADVNGRKKILTKGIALFTAASAAAPFSKYFIMLLICRFLQGVGAAMIFSTNMAIAVEAAGRDNRGKAAGIITASNYAGMAAGPAVGGLLTDMFTWRGIFYSGTILGIVIFLTLCTSKEIKEIEYDDNGEIKGESLIKNYHYCYAAVLTAVNYGACYVITYLFTSYLQYSLEYSSRTAGIILAAGPVIQAFLSTVAGKIADNHGSNKLVITGLLITGLSMIISTFFINPANLIIVILLQTTAGIGAALFSTPNVNAALEGIGKENYSMATAILAAMRSVGHVIGILTAAMVMKIYIGNESMAAAGDEMFQIIKTVFLLLGTVCVAGSFGKAILSKINKE